MLSGSDVYPCCDRTTCNTILGINTTFGSVTPCTAKQISSERKSVKRSAKRGRVGKFLHNTETENYELLVEVEQLCQYQELKRILVRQPLFLDVIAGLLRLTNRASVYPNKDGKQICNFSNTWIRGIVYVLEGIDKTAERTEYANINVAATSSEEAV